MRLTVSWRAMCGSRAKHATMTICGQHTVFLEQILIVCQARLSITFRL